MAFFGALGEFALGEAPASSSNVFISANVDALTLTELPAAVSFDVGVSASVASFTLTEHQATINLVSGVQASVHALTLTEHSASIAFDRGVAAASAGLTLSVHRATVGATVNADIEASMFRLALTTYRTSIYFQSNLEHHGLITGQGFEYTLDETITAGH